MIFLRFDRGQGLEGPPLRPLNAEFALQKKSASPSGWLGSGFSPSSISSKSLS
jgi:hypothetical protein